MGSGWLCCWCRAGIRGAACQRLSWSLGSPREWAVVGCAAGVVPGFGVRPANVSLGVLGVHGNGQWLAVLLVSCRDSGCGLPTSLLESWESTGMGSGWLCCWCRAGIRGAACQRLSWSLGSPREWAVVGCAAGVVPGFGVRPASVSLGVLGVHGSGQWLAVLLVSCRDSGCGLPTSLLESWESTGMGSGWLCCWCRAGIRGAACQRLSWSLGSPREWAVVGCAAGVVPGFGVRHANVSLGVLGVHGNGQWLAVLLVSCRDSGCGLPTSLLESWESTGMGSGWLCCWCRAGIRVAACQRLSWSLGSPREWAVIGCAAGVVPGFGVRPANVSLGVLGVHGNGQWLAVLLVSCRDSGCGLPTSLLESWESTGMGSGWLCCWCRAGIRGAACQRLCSELKAAGRHRNSRLQ
ncbi:unnamed protein product [Closterium sp. Yama58-4]|nr:unnamed protein product [Closterium sp. Yama58-4]